MTSQRSRPCLSVDVLRAASSRSALVTLCAAGLGMLCASHAAAQFAPGGVSGGVTTAVGGAPFIEAWVDFEIATLNATQVPPITPVVGCPDRPFPTINSATNGIRLAAGTGTIPLLSAENPGLVHVMPGIYGPATNGEQLPIQMWEFISIQGQSARACVIRGTGDTPNTFAFVPFTPLGDRAFWEVLADFSFLTDESYVEFLDGFTFQSGQIQVYCEPEEVDCQWRISNCVFDMLDMSDVGLPGPEFGILMSHTYDADYALVKGPKGKPVGVGGYHDVEAHIINNTFIQGWLPGNDGTVITHAERGHTSARTRNVATPVRRARRTWPHLRERGHTSGRRKLAKENWPHPCARLRKPGHTSASELTLQGPSAVHPSAPSWNRILAEECRLPMQRAPPSRARRDRHRRSRARAQARAHARTVVQRASSCRNLATPVRASRNLATPVRTEKVATPVRQNVATPMRQPVVRGHTSASSSYMATPVRRS
jgi:hypothetical protein